MSHVPACETPFVVSPSAVPGVGCPTSGNLPSPQCKSIPPEKTLRPALEKMDSRFRGNDTGMSLLRKQESRQLNKGALVFGEANTRLFSFRILSETFMTVFGAKLIDFTG
jgi:hypothetical protein